MNIEQAIRVVVDSDSGDAILETVTNDILDWPVWYYEMYGEVRPPLTGGGLKAPSGVLNAVRLYVEEYSKELGKNFEEDAVQAVLDRLLNYTKWAPLVVENAYWGQAAEDSQAYFDSYGSGYGQDDEAGVRGEF